MWPRPGEEIRDGVYGLLGSGRGGSNQGVHHRHPTRGGEPARKGRWSESSSAVVCPWLTTETDPLKPPYEGSGEA